MSMEQNELPISAALPAVSPASSEASAAGAQAAGAPNTQQQRRRRRRRKTGRVAVAAPENQSAALATAPALIEAAAEPVRQQSVDRNQDRNQDRNPDRGAPDRDARQFATRDGSTPDPNREQRGRQGRGQQAHGKKQLQRQAKATGGSSQGRQFPKGAQPQAPRESNPGNTNGQPSSAGRRKNKVRRAAPSFVGPMDHSYRTVNGNIADGSPSTMDYRSNSANGNGNGNVHGRNGYGDAAEMTVPALLREDAPVRIICFIEDLFVVAKMQETARKLGVKVSFVKAEKDTVTKLTDLPDGERPSLIVFDLNNANAKPLTLIPKLKAKLKRATSVIGFLSHIQGDLKLKAIEAGCDTVMPKAAFSQNLPNLLRRHGLDEEPEAVEA